MVRIPQRKVTKCNMNKNIEYKKKEDVFSLQI